MSHGKEQKVQVCYGSLRSYHGRCNLHTKSSKSFRNNGNIIRVTAVKPIKPVIPICFYFFFFQKFSRRISLRLITENKRVLCSERDRIEMHLKSNGGDKLICRLIIIIHVVLHLYPTFLKTK